jgi:hypothetical protein
MFADNPTFAIVLTVAVALVAGVLAWRGYVVRLRRGSSGLEATFDKPRDAPAGAISVGKGMAIEEGSVGDISGIKTQTMGATPADAGPIDVLEGAKVKDAHLGDISGVKISGAKDN